MSVEAPVFLQDDGGFFWARKKEKGEEWRFFHKSGRSLTLR